MNRSELLAKKKELRDANPWLTNEIIALNAKYDSMIQNGLIFDESFNIGGNEKVLLNQVFDFQIPSQIAVHYWYRINREWADWWTGLLMNKFNDELKDLKDIRFKENLHALVKYAILFGAAFMDNDGKAYVVSKALENNKYIVHPVAKIGLNAFTIENSQVKFNIEDKEVEDGVDGAIFIPRDLMVGDYITCIPYLGKLILEEFRLDRNMIFNNITTVIQTGDAAVKKSIANKITNPFITETFETKDLSKMSANINGDTIKYNLPPAELEISYATSDLNIKRLYEQWYNAFGRPVKSSTGAEITADANLGISSTEYINKLLFSRFLAFLNKLSYNNSNDVNSQEDTKIITDGEQNSEEGEREAPTRDSGSDDKDKSIDERKPDSETEGNGSNGSVENLIEQVKETRDELFEEGTESPQKNPADGEEVTSNAGELKKEVAHG